MIFCMVNEGIFINHISQSRICSLEIIHSPKSALSFILISIAPTYISFIPCISCFIIDQFIWLFHFILKNLTIYVLNLYIKLVKISMKS